MANIEKIASDIKTSNNNTRKKIKSSQWNYVELKDMNTTFTSFQTPNEFNWKQGMVGFLVVNLKPEDENAITISAFATGEEDKITLCSLDGYNALVYVSYLTTGWGLKKIIDKETGEEKIEVGVSFGNDPGYFDKKILADTNYKATIYYTNVLVDDVIETDVNSLALTMKQAKVDQEKLDLTLGDLIKVDQEKLDLTVNNINVDTENVSLWPTEIWGDVTTGEGGIVPRHDVEIINGIGQFTFVITGGGGLFKHSTLIKFQNGLKITSAQFNTDSGGTINMGEPSGSSIGISTNGIRIDTVSQWQGDISSSGLKATINGVIYDVTFTKTKPTKETK